MKPWLICCTATLPARFLKASEKLVYQDVQAIFCFCFKVWNLFLPLPPLSLFVKASFVAAHLLHDSAVCATFGWKIELHHQPRTSFKLKRPLLPYSLIYLNLPTHLVFSPCFKACNQLCWDAGPSSIPHWALSLSGHNTEPADC